MPFYLPGLIFAIVTLLVLPFYEITFVHEVDSPDDLDFLYLEETDIKPRRVRTAEGLGGTILFEGVIAWIIWVLLRRRLGVCYC